MTDGPIFGGAWSSHHGTAVARSRQPRPARGQDVLVMPIGQPGRALQKLVSAYLDVLLTVFPTGGRRRRIRRAQSTFPGRGNGADR